MEHPELAVAMVEAGQKIMDMRLLDRVKVESVNEVLQSTSVEDINAIVERCDGSIL